ncbi:hypothetical protein WT49_06100 [Burkholderia territorii]|nr:hypothetical protein WT49_06100 [Burkholderia territorii]KWE44021.1 hypothetical protein WT50_01445 [Burkholderia territorii]KWE45695.1 hypothetical protein WT51_19150 [Burkholderia territorii]
MHVRFALIRKCICNMAYHSLRGRLTRPPLVAACFSRDLTYVLLPNLKVMVVEVIANAPLSVRSTVPQKLHDPDFRCPRKVLN